MTCLVTGGAGFIGSTFVKYLLKKNESVVVLDSLTYAGNLDNLFEYITDNNLLSTNRQGRLSMIEVDENQKIYHEYDFSAEKTRLNYKYSNYINNVVPIVDLAEVVSNKLSENGLVFVNGSIVDKHVVNQLMSLCDTVINFAAETHVDRSIMSPDNFIKTDFYGTYVLLEASKLNDNLNKFVQISTDEIYGSATDNSFVETDPINPSNPYSASKAAADRLVFAYNQTYHLPINIVRLSNNYGPNQYPEKLIPLMIIKALRNERLPIYGDGSAIRDWLYVKDAVRGIDLVVTKSEPGETYNIAGRNEKENIEVVQYILNRLHKPDSLIQYVSDRPGHDRRYSIDDSKIREQLGFTQLSSFKTNLDSTIDWYVSNKKWWKKIIDDDKDYHEFMVKWYEKRGLEVN
jgi:dTDP-glucose 4,6-dehydratase